jgi:hypothetical protein
MNVYIGNKTICLAEREDKDSQEGYAVRYEDGSETWLVKEIFDFEFRQVTESEFDLMVSTVAQELTDDMIKEMFEDLPFLDDQEEVELDARAEEEYAPVLEVVKDDE